MIDRSTCWPEAVPIPDPSTDSCVNVLINGWFTRFGIPNAVTSDRGSVFTSSLWRAVATTLGLHTHSTTAYSPEANGMVERFHRTLKAALIAHCSTSTWTDELPWVLLGLRTTPKDDDCTTAEKVYGENLTVPTDFFPSQH